MSFDASDYDLVEAPPGTSRLVAERFPALPAFDRVATVDDLADVMELAGWTDDAKSAPRLSQIDRRDWVFGRPNSSVVMAAFLHGSPTGMRFSGPELGAWYAATELVTAILEVANALRSEIAASGVGRMTAAYRQFTADLTGAYIDIIGRHPNMQGSGAESYAAGQAFGRQVRSAGQRVSGIRYESARRAGHENWVCYRPPDVKNVLRAGLYEIDVPPEGKVAVRTLEKAIERDQGG